MLRLYATTLALSALLLFSVQPIIGKILLPVLGGSPAVWNTVVTFFQLVLLLGYGYAHVGKALLGSRVQAIVHAVLLAASLLFLPLAVSPEMLAVPAHAAPVGWLALVLLFTVGVPFFMLSANAPLLQSWLAGSKHPGAENPYILYVASNIGSMTGLLAYPFLAEPYFAVSEQKLLWSAGYGLLAVLMAVSIWQFFRARNTEAPKAAADAVKPVRYLRRFEWVLVAFIPSSLMLAVTAHITTDIAPIPLLWVIPLALYLLSFVLTFATRPIGVGVARGLFIPVVLPLALFMGLQMNWTPLWPWGIILIGCLVQVMLQRSRSRQSLFERAVNAPAVFLFPLALFMTLNINYLALCAWYLAGFFLVAMICHGRLSELKPKPEQLTEFYFFLSLGGALGGMFNTLVAPQYFADFYELQIGFALAFFVLPGFGFLAAVRRRPWALLGAVGAGVLVWYLYDGQFHDMGAIEDHVIRPITRFTMAKNEDWKNLGFETKQDILMFTAILLVAAMAFILRKRPLAIGAMMGILLLVGIVHPGANRDLRYQGRNFFGMLEVRYTLANNSMQLTNGTTSHGYQFKDEERATTPTSYYSWDGPLGTVIENIRVREGGFRGDIAAVGLGAGTVACLASTGQHVTFFEINPRVDALAHDPKYFSYLRDCPGMNDVVLGDARLSLKNMPNAKFSLIILDAFNSDAIPIHLITREALQLYLDRLSDDGIIAYHISNRHLNLEPVVGNLASERNLYGITGSFNGSNWVFMARRAQVFGLLTQDPRFKLLVPDSRKHVWTDDYSDIISIIE